MKFSREGIADFVSEGKNYITWRTGIGPNNAKDFFYSGRNLEEQYQGVDIKCCNLGHGEYLSKIAQGDFVTGLKYVVEGENYYIFLGANSFYEHPQSIAIGKAQAGKIYLIYENVSQYKEYKECFIIIPEEYIYKNVKGVMTNAYRHTIQIPHSKAEKDKNKLQITHEDIKCLQIAYEGVKAFKNLIKGFQ